jgi:hypothetical protein
VAIDNKVSAWSEQYIPYEPKDWRRGMREELKAAIGEISPNDSGLYAVYISESSKFCDAENVLFYNVGAKAFKDLSRNGLCFERGFSKAPTVPDGRTMDHYYLYDQGDEFRIWERDEIIANWQKSKMPAPTSTSKPHLFWYALKTGEMNCPRQEAQPKQFGLDITLNIPEAAWCNLAALVKPLLDGVISAFHTQNDNHDRVALERLAERVSSSTAEVEKLLRGDGHSILGERRIISTFGKGIIWNPEDDICVACRVATRRSVENTSWSMDGQLFSLRPKVA